MCLSQRTCRLPTIIGDVQVAVNSLEFSEVDWAPQITITVDGSATPSVSTEGSQDVYTVGVQAPEVQTAPAH
jgi:hypothetical protein